MPGKERVRSWERNGRIPKQIHKYIPAGTTESMFWYVFCDERKRNICWERNGRVQKQIYIYQLTESIIIRCPRTNLAHQCYPEQFCCDTYGRGSISGYGKGRAMSKEGRNAAGRPMRHKTVSTEFHVWDQAVATVIHITTLCCAYNTFMYQYDPMACERTRKSRKGIRCSFPVPTVWDAQRWQSGDLKQASFKNIKNINQ